MEIFSEMKAVQGGSPVPAVDPRYKLWFREIGVETASINRFFRERYGRIKTGEIRRRVYQMWLGGMPAENLRKKILAREEEWILQDAIQNISPESIKDLQERGGEWAVFQNRASYCRNFGHIRFLKYGIGCTFDDAPERFPNDSRYLLVGFVDLTDGVVVTLQTAPQ